MRFVIYTNTDWEAPPRSRHQLAYALAKKGFKTTFVAANSMGKPSLETIRVNENLEVILPKFPVSRRLRYRTPGLNEGYQLWLFPALRKRFDKDDTYVVCFDFGGYLVGKYFPKLIYYASDDYINNVKLPFFIKAYTTFTQKKLVQTSKMSLATARKLVNDFKEVNAKSFELPLGAPDFNPGLDHAEILRERDGKIKVVLLGFIDKVKTPVSLLRKILQIHNTELYLIGPVKDDILDDLQPAARVFRLGVQTGEVLAKSLLAMDVGIAPYYMEDSNTGRTPNKMWQYLAAGKPVVVTDLPNIQHWEFPEGTVYKASEEDVFVQMVEKAYREDSQALVAKRIELAKNNSWTRRVDQLLEYVKVNMEEQ